ncbi:MAG: 50S ribosomal protein L24 [Candidatus Omnitrophica bacterium]|nr:50S ribosomal protein L24 [Candidatus Omnitrophota bacterium]
MQKIKKNDIVEVTKGKDKGKKGKVLEVISETKRAVIEGINLVKKHKRQTRQEEKGGIVSIEKPISVSNLMVVCKECNKGVRVGMLINKDGTKSRICKVCKGVL